VAQAKQILRRVKSVTNTRKITRAMEMVASAKLKGAQKKALDLKVYADHLLELLQMALAHPGMGYHSLLEERPADLKDEQGNPRKPRTAIVLLASDKGLCGGFNTNVIKEGLRVWREEAQECGGFLVVGAKARDAIRREKLPLYRELSLEQGKPHFRDASKIISWIVEHYRSKAVDRVVLVYTDFVSPLTQLPKVLNLLPFSAVVPDPDSSRSLYWEPSAEEVLDRLIPEYLGGMVFRALLESTASEFASRRVAMKSATDNATDMIADLTLQYNRARQAAITQEIAEIVGGASALE
jgi:F-type H+-transporting ATPase subunit gamma